MNDDERKAALEKIYDPPFKAGDRVIFLVDFSHAGVYVPPGTLGEVTRDGPPLPGTGFQFVSVSAKNRLWLCKPSEIRKMEHQAVA